MSGCKAARPSGQYHGWECSVSGGECMYLIPDSKACAEDFGEGPDAVHGECKECEKFYLDNGRRCCKEGTAKLKDGEYIVDQYIEDDVVCCGAFNPKGMSA